MSLPNTLSNYFQFDVIAPFNWHYMVTNDEEHYYNHHIVVRDCLLLAAPLGQI